MRNILVLRGGALGDFIVTLPALALLRQRWPAARIELIGNATAATLARNRGLLDAVHSQHEARWAALFRAGDLPSELSAWLRRFDLVVNYWPDPDGELRARFPLRDDQVYSSAEAMPVRAPAAAHYCEPLRKLGLDTEEYFYRLHVGRGLPTPPTVSPPGKRRGAETPPYIAIHPGSGSPRKNWPMENWLEFIRRWPEPITLILGEAEAETWSLRAPATASLLRSRPLEELVAHFAGCRLFLGHDSGISHLAAATGVPCVLLFGPTAAAMWAPPAPNVRVIQRGPDLRALSLDDVAGAAEAALADRR